MALGVIVCLIMFIIPLIISIVLAIWIYKDANKRGKEGIVWAIVIVLITLLLGIVGFIISIILTIVWLVTRPPIGGEPTTVSSDRRCPNCGRPIPTDARVCPYCAKKFDQYL